MSRHTIAAAGLAMMAAGAAQADALPPPQNVLGMSAQASVEATQDLLSITLGTVREGADAAAVQSQLRQALDTALNEARKAAKPGQVDVRTGQFALNPRYGQKGQINGWQGSAELVLEGRDMSTIAQLSGRLSTLTVSRVGYALSREAREKLEADAAAQAITRFRARASDYARQFGFGGYTLREISIGAGEQVMPPMPIVRSRAMASAMADESVPVEAGKATVTVTVTGTVQLTK